jgi:predicted transcriptional regulator
MYCGIVWTEGELVYKNPESNQTTGRSHSGREVKLMMATSLEKPSYEEYWPDMEGLAQRERVTDEHMPSQTKC